jgi:DNA-binding CsgD family transcriptional regulator
MASSMFASRFREKLTKRELECIQLIMRGRTAKEMADVLGLSPRTVEFYINNIKSKIGCSKKSKIVDYILGLSA